MKSLNKREAMLRALCARIDPDHDTDPRLDRKERRIIAHKDQQVCKQAAAAIADEFITLRSLADTGIELIDIQPEKGAKRLVITVAYDTRLTSEADVLQRLGAARGRLRAAMARVIARKRVPDLSFAALPREAVRDE